MRKKVEPDKICNKCGTVLKHSDEVVFCDICKEQITIEYPLDVKVFWMDADKNASRIECCSWKCVKESLRKFSLNKKKVHFICLPYIADYSTGNFSSELDLYLKTFEENSA